MKGLRKVMRHPPGELPHGWQYAGAARSSGGPWRPGAGDRSGHAVSSGRAASASGPRRLALGAGSSAFTMTRSKKLSTGLAQGRQLLAARRVSSRPPRRRRRPGSCILGRGTQASALGDVFRQAGGVHPGLPTDCPPLLQGCCPRVCWLRPARPPRAGTHRMAAAGGGSARRCRVQGTARRRLLAPGNQLQRSMMARRSKKKRQPESAWSTSRLPKTPHAGAHQVAQVDAQLDEDADHAQAMTAQGEGIFRRWAAG